MIMTNQEIKFELARIALGRCNFLTCEMLVESLKNIYEWVVEEPDVEVESHEQNEYDNIPVSEILKCVRKNNCIGSNVTEKLAKTFYANDIETAGDLLKIGRNLFKKYRSIGKKSVWALDDAFTELGVKGW